jgi:hypothetical protein
MRHEDPDLIRAKITSAGGRNPRYVTAVAEMKDAKARMKDLVGNYRHLSKAQIAREYTPEKVQSLLAAAQENLRRITAPVMRPGYMPED